MANRGNHKKPKGFHKKPEPVMEKKPGPLSKIMAKRNGKAR